MCALNPDVPFPCGESNPIKDTSDGDFGMETYNKIKSALVQFKQRGKRTEAVVSRAQKYLMIGVGWIGFKNTDELDTWCVVQMNKAHDLIKTIIENSFDPEKSPRTKIVSILRYVRPPPPPMRVMKKMAAHPTALHAAPPPPPPPINSVRSLGPTEEYDDEAWFRMLDEKTAEHSHTALPLPPPSNSLRSLRSTDEYDDDTWIRMLDDETKSSLCEKEDICTTISCASSADTRNATPDSDSGSVLGDSLILLSTVQNLFLPSFCPLPSEPASFPPIPDRAPLSPLTKSAPVFVGDLDLVALSCALAKEEGAEKLPDGIDEGEIYML